jgi:hypothetical protein
VAIVCAREPMAGPALENGYVAGRFAADKGGVPSDAPGSQSVASGHRTPLQAVAVSEDATQLRATGQE